MRILVTGSKGQLGHDLMEVVGSAAITEGQDLPELDITQSEAVQTTVARFRPDIIVNCAAYTNVDKAETEVNTAWAVNKSGVENLARAADPCGARLLHVSTDYVFDGTRTRPGSYTETDEPNPGSVYGKSKLAGEMAVQETLSNYVILRTAWLYGMHGRNFLKTILRVALRNSATPLRVVNDQFGSPTWSRRLALQVQALFDHGQGVYHASAEGSCTWYELARTFLEAMEIECPLEPCSTAEYPTAAHRPENSVLENARLKAEGLNIMAPWEADVREYAARHRKALLDEARAQ